jgi:hypothetical protein
VRIIFATNLSAQKNNLLTEEEAEHRLLSWYYVYHLGRDHFKEYIETGKFPVPLNGNKVKKPFQKKTKRKRLRAKEKDSG